ncbi:hypothetical protein [Pinirhizobacter soli]|uniref:hypothetical protein n=1 Tax=Pinirhizobacter soli TaxID=2786953 RepID=UPI002029DB5D|nr:hypothetical protein [Pinirhizobacter soli]
MRLVPAPCFPSLQLMFIIFGCLLAGTARAGITLDSMHAYLAPNRSTGELTVYNMSPITAYVRVDVIEMTVKGDELGAVPGEAEKAMLASPNRLIVPAGGRQVVRLIALGERDHERYFRVRFVPVAPKKADGFAISDEDESEASKAIHAQLNIQVGYGARVVVAPRSPKFATRIVPVEGGHVIHNDGDSTIYLAGHRSCRRGSHDCTEQPVERVDPLGSLLLANEPGRYRSFDLKEGAAAIPETIGDND